MSSQSFIGEWLGLLIEWVMNHDVTTFSTILLMGWKQVSAFPTDSN